MSLFPFLPSFVSRADLLPFSPDGSIINNIHLNLTLESLTLKLKPFSILLRRLLPAQLDATVPTLSLFLLVTNLCYSTIVHFA